MRDSRTIAVRGMGELAAVVLGLEPDVHLPGAPAQTTTPEHGGSSATCRSTKPAPVQAQGQSTSTTPPGRAPDSVTTRCSKR